MNLNNIDFNKLAIFAKIVEAGNYRLASEVLNVTPSALSQTITTLEHSLGVPLFHRYGKRLVLTERGEKIRREVTRHQNAFTQALAQIAGPGKEVSGLVHIGAYLEFAKFQLAPLMADFQKKHPGVQVKFVFDTPSRLHRMLEQRQIDICFSIYPERDSQLIESQPIYRQELLLVSPPGMLKDRPSFAEVVAAPIVEYYFNHQPIRRWIALHFKKKPKQLPIRTLGATAEMVLALIQAGLGIGMVPEYLLPENLPTNIKVCRPTARKLMDSIWMLQIKSPQRSPALKAFTESVVNSFG